MHDETLMEIHAREKIQAPPGPGFAFWLFETLPETPPAQVIKLTGAVAPLFTRGPRKGEPNFKKSDPATRREVFLPVEEHKAWVEEWEKKTGLCSHCQGKGQRPAGWSAETGSWFKSCGACGGSGSGKTQNKMMKQLGC